MEIEKKAVVTDEKSTQTDTSVTSQNGSLTIQNGAEQSINRINNNSVNKSAAVVSNLASVVIDHSPTTNKNVTFVDEKSQDDQNKTKGGTFYNGPSTPSSKHNDSAQNDVAL